jgi:glycosyltransferase involved in cell wall biosynthesis
VKIAQIAPLYESVPPTHYGGTERIVSYLTEELVRQGHDVTLFASADSTTEARLVSVCDRSLRFDPACRDPLVPHVRLLERVAREAPTFDILHFHCDYLHFPWSRRAGRPQLTTLHGRLDLPDLGPLYEEFGDMPVVSISDAQRVPLPQARWLDTVHHGLPPDLYGPPVSSASPDPPEGYLLFLGRISPEKRLDRAIEIARLSGWPLLVAAKVDRQDRQYFDTQIAPLLEEPFVTFLGEVGEAEKRELLSGARALLFPIDWPEPFGLVMIEAMASGTPVIAWRGGSVEEILTPGVTGFVVDTLEEAVAAVRCAAGLDRRVCREVFDQRFTVQRMAADYIRLYERLATQPVRGVLRTRAGAGRVA